MKLNEKVIEYQQTRSEVLFSEIYRKVFSKSVRLIDSLANRYKLDTLDVESLVNEKIYDMALSYADRGDFINAVRTAIRNGCIDLSRKCERIRENEADPMVYDEESEEYAEVYEVIEVAPTTEFEVITEIRKSIDQRQLIDDLLKNADDAVYQTISAFEMTDSYRQAAKLTRTCHKTVQARIRRLATEFSEEIHGSYYDYFTLPTATQVG